jgi:DNA-directed RNA polymerase subunit alpha
MVLEFQTLVPEELPIQEKEVIPDASVKVLEEEGNYGKFVTEPLERGYGTTLGNSLRRVLYESLTGTAVTWVKIDGAMHEYTTLPHIREEISELLLNIKGIRLKSDVNRTGKLRLEVVGQGKVCGGDIMASSDFHVVNPESHIATLDSDQASLNIEFNVERGSGFRPGVNDSDTPIGVLPVDAIFTPIRKVNFAVEPTRVGGRTDFEKLTIEIWTDGSISPLNSLKAAGDILVNKFFMFANVQEGDVDSIEASSTALNISPEQYNMTVESLDLSSRTLNCLKRAAIHKVGEALQYEKSDLLKIRNFGEKSMRELYDKFAELGLPIEGSTGEKSVDDDNQIESQEDES